MRFDAILFDLDGTLVDSAPDLAGAVNELRADHDLPALPYAQLRPLAGAGARGMLGAGFGVTPADAAYAGLRDAFIDRYRRRLLQETAVFDAVPLLLGAIEARPRPWGVVTNKATGLAEPLLSGLHLRQRAAVLVGGDTTPHGKPHPAPLLHAARELGLDPTRCVYVGDDLRDVQAGRAAGMCTVAVRWGYLGVGEAIDDWGADRVVDDPQALLNWLELA
ncbi:MAG: phosphoglycolate phosphatase [Rubrivivax sp.]